MNAIIKSCIGIAILCFAMVANAQSFKPKFDKREHRTWVHTIGISSDLNTCATVDEDNKIVIRNLETGKPISKVSSNSYEEAIEYLAKSLKKDVPEASAFEDLKKQFPAIEKYQLEQEYEGENRFIKCLELSPNKELLAIAGGEEVMLSTTYGNSTKVWSSGFIKLIDSRTGKTLRNFSTENGKAHDMQITGLVWTNDFSFLAVNKLGELFYYEAKSDLPYKSIYNPGNASTALDISDNFEQLIFSNTNGITGFYNFKNSTPLQIIDSSFYNYVLLANEQQYSYNACFMRNHQQYWETGQQKIKTSDVISDISDRAALKNGTLDIYCGKILENYYIQPYPITENQFFADEKERIIGYHIGGHLYYSSKLSRLNQTTIDNFEHHPGYGIQVIEKGTENIESYSLIPSISADQVSISYDGKYLECKNWDGSDFELFNLRNRTWLDISQKTYNKNTKINAIQFDPYSELALVSFDDASLYLWNTDSEELKEISASILGQEGVLSEVILAMKNDKVSIHKEKNSLYFASENKLKLLNWNTGKIEVLNNLPSSKVLELKASQNNHYLALKYFNQNTGETLVYAINCKNNQASLINKNTVISSIDQSELNGKSDFCFFHATKNLIFIHDGYGELSLVDLEKSKHLVTLKLLSNGHWLAFSPTGCFDADKNGRESLYYVEENEVILYSQVKERFWETNLVGKLIKNPQLKISGSLIYNLELYPNAKLSLDEEANNIIVDLQKRSGGIGKVSLYINNSRRIEDINPNRQKSISIDLSSIKEYLYPQGTNKISVETYNKKGWMTSRQISLFLDTDLTAYEAGQKGFSTTIQTYKDTVDLTPGLFGLFVGTASYKDPKLNLNFSDDDAYALKDGFTKISKGMYDPSRVKLYSLTSDAQVASNLPTKENILKSLDQIAQEALPHDIIVLFFSGHGITVDDDFYYLTGEAGNFDLQQEPERRTKVTVSSKEILSKLEKIKSNKQVIIIDACHSGQISKILAGASKAISTSQEKALEFLEDKMGVYILASSESNQKSFETAALEKGLLTFGLLRGMSGGTAKDGIINIIDLLNYAANEAENVGKLLLQRTQRPVLNIAKGGSSFPIGFENKELTLPLPKDKLFFGEPRFAQIPQLSDPIRFNESMKASLSEMGAFGSGSNILYSKQGGANSFNLAGSYKIIEDEILVEWYILQNEKVIKGPYQAKPKTIAKQARLAKVILNKAARELSQK